MNELSKAFVKAQKEFGPALKTSTNPHLKTKYANLASCVEAVLDALNANGIALMQTIEPSEHGVAVKTVFMHESGEKMDCGVCTVPVAKNDPQGYGSALTYARRYSLMTACGIAPEDDDGNAAQKSVTKPQQAQQPAKPTPQRLSYDVLKAGHDCTNEDDLRKWFLAAKFEFKDDPEVLKKIMELKDAMKEELSQGPTGLIHIGSMIPGEMQLESNIGQGENK